MNTLASRINKSPRIKGEWLPIYIEPIHMSGERFTIAIAAIANTGEVHVFKTIDSNLIKAMYQDRSDEILGIIDFALTSLSQFIAQEKSLQHWHSPLSGIIKGKVTQAEGVEFQHIINQGIQRCSSLSGLYTGRVEENDEQVQEQQVRTAIKTCLIDINSDYKSCINKIIDLGDVRERRYSFIHPKYAANVAVASHNASSLNRALVKVLDINDLKADPSSLFEKMEIIITAPISKPINSTIVDQVKAEAERYKLGCVIIDGSPEKTAEYIHKKVATG
ncbi:MAG: hypothetical protein LUQ26_02315 [Methylococcaceae bacterium]|nr:hypothetical protein [Methylococcaceae bacterium]